MFFNVKTKNEMIKITVIKNPTKTEHLHSFFIEYAGILKKNALKSKPTLVVFFDLKKLTLSIAKIELTKMMAKFFSDMHETSVRAIKCSAILVAPGHPYVLQTIKQFYVMSKELTPTLISDDAKQCKEFLRNNS